MARMLDLNKGNWTAASILKEPGFIEFIRNETVATIEPKLFVPSPHPGLDIGRNDPCWCKSGKKYKLCCLGK
jgi:uncharacterized protein YecA (UPF0149 family)